MNKKNTAKLGVTDAVNMKKIIPKLSAIGMNMRKQDWGIQFYHKYEGHTPLPEEI